jgi:hypothetical protein
MRNSLKRIALFIGLRAYGRKSDGLLQERHLAPKAPKIRDSAIEIVATDVGGCWRAAPVNEMDQQPLPRLLTTISLTAVELRMKRAAAVLNLPCVAGQRNLGPAWAIGECILPNKHSPAAAERPWRLATIPTPELPSQENNRAGTRCNFPTWYCLSTRLQLVGGTGDDTCNCRKGHECLRDFASALSIA